VREIEFRAYLSEDQFKRLRQNKPSAGLVSGVLAVTLAWIFSAVSLGPSKLEFGELQVGSGSSLPVKLTNRGMTEFHAASLGVEGENSGDFKVDTAPCATVAPGESCVVWVDFRPRETGTKLARLIVRTKDGSEFSSNFTGTATKGVNPVRRPVGPPPPPPPNPPHAVRPPSPVGPSATIVPPPPPEAPPPDRPSPTTPNVNEPSPPAPPQAGPSPPIFVPPYRPASGVIPEPAELPQIRIEPGTMDFSRPPARRRQVTIANSGTAPLRLGFGLIGPDRGSFEYDPNACGAVLVASRQCVVTVSYNPPIDDSGKQVLTAWLSVRHDASNAASPQMVALRWRRTGPLPQPHVTVTPGVLSFSGPPAGAEFYNVPPQTVTIRNDGTVGLRQLSLRLGPGGPFTLSNSCPTSLARGQTCTAQVTFTPRDARQYAGTLNGFEGSLQLASVNLRGGSASPPVPKPQPSRLLPVDRAGKGTGQGNRPPPGNGTADGPRQPKAPQSGRMANGGSRQPTSPSAGDATNKTPRAQTPRAPTRNAPSKILQRTVRTVPPQPPPVK